MGAESEQTRVLGVEYWLNWQVGACALIILIPSTVAAAIAAKRIRNKRGGGRDSDHDDGDGLRRSDLWVPCWSNLSPVWVLVYRVFAMAIMGWILYLMVLFDGLWSFNFYTIWTLTLLTAYFGVGAIISAQGCMTYLRSSVEVGETDELLKNKEGMNGLQEHGCHDKAIGWAGYLGNMMHITYLTCAGAVLMTDIVFWCVLVPTQAGIELNLLIISMHSLNAVFLLGDSALNSIPFGWFGFIYFFLCGAIYVTSQWILRIRDPRWWPYPFLDLANPWAPLWYLGLTVFHIPCYGIYVVIMKGKASVCWRLFPNAFVRKKLLGSEKLHSNNIAYPSVGVNS
ncbi:hypothetical protein Droror1_Dr00003774 [Drosera rotundifolia]